jgi:hypothetical protein
MGWTSLALSIQGVRHGDGRHAAALTQSQLEGATFYTLISQTPAILSFCFPKLAVIALLTRLMNPSTRHRIFLWFLGISVFIFGSMCFIIMYSQCVPVYSQWDFSITEKTCWDPMILVNFSIFTGCKSHLLQNHL